MQAAVVQHLCRLDYLAIRKLIYYLAVLWLNHSCFSRQLHFSFSFSFSFSDSREQFINWAVNQFLCEFLPCDAMRKRVSAMFAIAWCLSVCLSVSLTRWCIASTRLKMSSNLFLGSVDPSF